jgi:hypothetical protein
MRDKEILISLNGLDPNWGLSCAISYKSGYPHSIHQNYYEVIL